MRIGIPKEIKPQEYRVGATPAMVRQLVASGHEVVVETQAGAAVGFGDAQFCAAGAVVVKSAGEVWASEMVIKVKEPQASEYPLLKEGQILFCFLHLAPDPEQAKALIASKVVAIAYETVVERGQLPLLLPMSEIAGRLAIQMGAVSLQMNNGGKGVLLGGVPGVLPAKVAVIGGGVVGTEAARMAMGLGADVTLLDYRLDRLKELDCAFGPRLKTLYSTAESIEHSVAVADLVIGAVLVPGGLAPRLITRQMVQSMAPGSVIVDVAVDQGGCAETTRPTTHANPTYVEEGVVHYGVTNMPGGCAHTATLALTNATTRYALALAEKGWREALRANSGLKEGLNVCLGAVTNRPVADDLGYSYVAAETML